MLQWRDRLPWFGPEKAPPCGCRVTVEDGTLVVDAHDCPGAGRLEVSPDCRETVVAATTDRGVEAVRVETAGVERTYDGAAADLLVAAGRFVERVGIRDDRLARRGRRDPLAAGREACGRADAVSTVASETGLADIAGRFESYETALAPVIGPTISRWRVDRSPPRAGELLAVRELETGATVRRYRVDGPDRYHLTPVENRLGDDALAALAAAYGRLASGAVGGGDRAPFRAVRSILSGDGTDTEAITEGSAETTGGVIDRPTPLRWRAVAAESTDPERWTASDIPVETVTNVLEKHTSGHGLLADLFADSAVSDVFVTAPANDNTLRVTVDGETLVTNVRLTEAGVDGLSARFRRESGRAFSRADPTLDATTMVGDRRVRIAGITDPASDGTAFAFRAQDRDVWTLPALLGNGTVSPEAAALLSLAVERGSALLTAGPRGAGKTTMLGALLWELPPAVRTVVIEDTPELPVDALQSAGRDVQALLASANREELSPAEALRTALRLGDGALAVGEVRGEEAAVLYEAMRVGAKSEAVLGTIHGDGAGDVYERVVADLGVAATSFGATDLVVTLENATAGRRVRLIQEVVGGETPQFEALFERTAEKLEPTGRIDRGNSSLVASLSSPAETYADVRDRLAERRRLLAGLAEREATDGDAVTDAHACRR